MANGNGSAPAAPRKRADARRNEAMLLDAAAAAFVESGVNVPVREIAARAGVGVGTIYRHFPARADLIVAVYRHQVEACADAGPGGDLTHRHVDAGLDERRGGRVEQRRLVPPGVGPLPRRRRSRSVLAGHCPATSTE